MNNEQLKKFDMRLSDMRHEITGHEIAGQARNDARLSPLSCGEGSGERLKNI